MGGATVVDVVVLIELIKSLAGAIVVLVIVVVVVVCGMEDLLVSLLFSSSVELVDEVEIEMGGGMTIAWSWLSIGSSNGGPSAPSNLTNTLNQYLWLALRSDQ